MTIKVCHECKGTGETIQPVEREFNHGRMGTGYTYLRCPVCEGSGLVKEKVTYEPYSPVKRA